MPFEDPWLREGKTISPLDEARRLYEQTHNPLHAWRALQICTELMRDGSYPCDTLPPWLLEYMSASANKVQEIFNEDLGEVDDVPKLIAAALGFQQRGRGVRRQAFRELTRAQRDLDVAIQVHRELRLQPTQSIEASVAAVAEVRQVSPESIWRAWSAWKDFVDDPR